MFAELLAKIEERGALVGVIGLGYVGLPLIKAFIEAGFNTLGFAHARRELYRPHQR